MNKTAFPSELSDSWGVWEKSWVRNVLNSHIDSLDKRGRQWETPPHIHFEDAIPVKGREEGIYCPSWHYTPLHQMY